MRIVIFIDHLRPDGSQFKLRQIVRGLTNRGHPISVICLNDSYDEKTLESVQQAGAHVEIIGKMQLIFGIGLLRIFLMLKQGHYDSAITFLFASDVIGRPLAKLAGIDFVISSIETRDEFYSFLQKKLISQTARFCDVSVICSQHLREFVVQKEGISDHKIKVIYNSIPVVNYSTCNNPANLRKEYGLEEDAFIIGSLGRLTHQKGFDIMLQAIQRINQTKLVCLIGGLGEEEANLKSQAINLGLEHRVLFIGYRRDAIAFLHGIDLYVQSSRYEGMPIAVLEAMASRKPVVVTGVDGSRELISSEAYGWIVPPEDPKALASAIIDALTSKEELQKRAVAGQRRVVENFNEEKMLDTWEKVLLKEV